MHRPDTKSWLCHSLPVRIGENLTDFSEPRFFLQNNENNLSSDEDEMKCPGYYGLLRLPSQHSTDWGKRGASRTEINFLIVLEARSLRSQCS